MASKRATDAIATLGGLEAIFSRDDCLSFILRAPGCGRKTAYEVVALALDEGIIGDDDQRLALYRPYEMKQVAEHRV